MKLLIQKLELETIPKPELIPGGEKPENYDLNQYKILNTENIDDWFYIVKSGKFYNVVVKNKIIYSINTFDTTNASLLIEQTEDIKKSITYSGKVQRDDMMKIVLENENKINIVKSRVDMLCKYLNLNI
jgi:hypothetical protein